MLRTFPVRVDDIELAAWSMQARAEAAACDPPLTPEATADFAQCDVYANYGDVALGDRLRAFILTDVRPVPLEMIADEKRRIADSPPPRESAYTKEQLNEAEAKWNALREQYGL